MRVSQWGQGLFGQLSSVAGMCVQACVFKGDSEWTPCLFEREFYRGNHLVALRWHGVSQQAGTRIFRAHSNESKWQFGVSSGLKAIAQRSVIGGCYYPLLMGAAAPRLVWERGLREVK